MVHTIIVGNGLGMALDPDYFTIQASVNKVWNDLTPEEKELLGAFFNSRENGIPQIHEKSQDLADINTLSLLTDFIKRLTDKGERHNLLNENGKNFQSTVNSFVWGIGYFYQCFESKTIQKNPSLSKFGQNFKRLFESRGNETIHVATLNYDNLL